MTLNALKVEENLITIFVLLVSTVFVANLEYYWALGREFHDQWSVALLGADEHKLEEWEEEGDKAGAQRGGRETSNSIGAILLLYKTRNTSQSSYVLCKTVNRKKPQNLILIIKLINASF